MRLVNEIKIGFKKTIHVLKTFWISLCVVATLFAFKSDSDSRTNKELFEEIIFSYVDQFPKIANDCNAKPFYKINFVSSIDTIKFWVAGHIGKPSPVTPVKPGNTPPENPKELKGVVKINRQSFVIYDYKNSDGYKLYNPNYVNKRRLKIIENIDDECAAGVVNPEAWLVAISDGKLLIIDKREPYRIQL